MSVCLCGCFESVCDYDEEKWSLELRILKVNHHSRVVRSLRLAFLLRLLEPFVLFVPFAFRDNHRYLANVDS